MDWLSRPNLQRLHISVCPLTGITFKSTLSGQLLSLACAGVVLAYQESQQAGSTYILLGVVLCVDNPCRFGSANTLSRNKDQIYHSKQR